MRATSSAVIGLATLALYLVLTPPVPGDGDSGEFTIVLARAALAHPTGYPLYTLLGHLFCAALNAFGASWAFAAGAWSALGGALAVFFFSRLSDRLVGEQPTIGGTVRFLLVLTPTIAFLLNPMVSFEATHAEVYSWHLAWVCGASLLFVRIVHALRGGIDLGSTRVGRLAVAWGLVVGVGIAHHTTAAFFAAPMSLVLLWCVVVARPRRLWPVGACVAAAIVPFLSYGFVFWRIGHPSGADWGLFTPTVEGAIEHIRATSYRQWVFGTFKPTEIQRDFLERWIYPCLFAGMALLVIGALIARRKPLDRIVLWAMVAGAAANILFAFRLRVSDPSSYFLAPLALGLAAFAPVAAAVAARIPPGRARLGAAALAAAALAIGASWFAIGLDRKTAMIESEALIRGMWNSIPTGPGIVFWNSDMHHRLRAFQILDGEKTELGIWYAAGLAAPVQRAKFKDRHGCDPLEGLPGPRIDGNPHDYFRALHRNVNRQTSVPVYEFEPEHQAVRLLKKPARAESR